MTPTRKAIAAIGAGVLLFAACGDDDDSSLFDDDDAEDTAADGTDDDDDSDDSVPVSDAGDFCDVVGELESFDELEDSFADPDAIESQVSEVREIYTQGAELVPDEIADDFELVSESLTTFADAFADAGYNILDVRVSAITELEDPELEAATDRLEEYGESECGVEPDDDEEEDEDNSFEDMVDDLPEGATIRDGIVQQFITQGIAEDAAQCIGDRLEPADLEDDQRITDHLESCGIDPTTGEPTDD